MNRITCIQVIVASYMSLFSIIILNIILWKGYLDGRKIKKKTYELRKDLTREKVKDYIIFLDKTEIPPRSIHRDMVRAGYELVRMNGEIDEELVKELKIIILCKGIPVK